MNQRDLVAQIIQQIFSAIPLGPLLGNLVGTPVTNWLSPDSSMSNAIVWPGQGQSIGNAALNYINDIYSKGFSVSGKSVSNEAELRALMAYHKMLNPGKTDNEYLGMAENSMKNPMDIGGLLYQFTDPYKMTQGLSEAGSLASILTRRGSTFGIEGSKYAHDISQAIYGFTTDEGEKVDGIIMDIIKNQKDYGNMTVAGAMTVGRELALTDKNGFRGDDGRFESDRFKDRLQKVTKALEPWQDIFGKDIPKLLNQFEALTGTSIGATSSGDIERMGSRMSSILASTGARIQHIAAYRDTLAHGLADPTMSNRSILGAGALAGDLTLGLANLNLGYMTQQELQGVTGVAYAGMAKSKYADRYALAYARWAQDNGKDKAKFEDFDAALRASGLSGNDALLSVSGARNLTELEVYRGTNEFLSAHRTGSASRATNTAAIGEILKGFREEYSSGRYGGFNEAVKNMINNMDDIQLTEFLGKSKSDKQAFIQEHAGVDRHTALQIASDIGEAAAGSYNSVTGEDFNIDKARSQFAVASNYNHQVKQAQEIENFNTAVRDLFRPGRLHGVIEDINKSGKDFHVSEHLQNYFGGSNLLAAMAKTMSGLSKDEINENLPMLEKSMNFIKNNYANLSSQYSEVFTDLSGRDTWRGHLVASALNSVNHKTLSKISTKDRDALVSLLQTEAGTGEDLGGIARDFVMDRNIESAISSFDISGDDSKQKAAQNLKRITEGYHGSYNDLKKALENDSFFKDPNNKDALKHAKTIMSNAGVGDVDGNDPLHRIADFLSDIPTKMNSFIDELANAIARSISASSGDRTSNSL